MPVTKLKRALCGAVLLLAGAAGPLACSGGDGWQGGGRNYNVTLSNDAGTASQPDTGSNDSSTGFDAPFDAGSPFDAATE